MPQVRDLFFEEFYEELERVVSGIDRSSDQDRASKLGGEVAKRWNTFLPDLDERDEALISVDGGVQHSSFAYGNFVAVGRACALVHRPDRKQAIHKRVKIYVDAVYDERDRGYIPSYVRMIAEYDAARMAAEGVLEAGGKPLAVLDGSLYFSRFPYAIHEYQHHPELLAELFSSISSLHDLSRARDFPLVAVAKDSTVYYLHMELLKQAAAGAGLTHLIPLIDEASSPLDLRMKMAQWEPESRKALESLLDDRPACDTALIEESVEGEGFTTPLLLAPSIYYGREGTPALYRRISNTIDSGSAIRVISALRSFFSSTGVAVTYFKPERKARPMRVDLSASIFGYAEPWENRKKNVFVENRSLESLMRAIAHLRHWYCNEVEYNMPLHHADRLARFDGDLYKSRYEPFIIKRLDEAGLDVRGRRRALREAWT